jgi:hypothetical protein
VLVDLRNEFRRQAGAHRARADGAALLGGRVGDKAGVVGGGGGGGDATADDILLRERASLLGSSRAVDDILSQAAETGETLRAQRGAIGSAAGRLGSILQRVPGASALMGAIDARRSRNDTIVYACIAACVCYTAYFLLSARR